MERELDVAKRAALEAGKILMKYYGRVDTSSKKDGSPVTKADTESEEKIRSILMHEFPDYAFIGEESGVTGSGEFTWVVDPLDGTTNYSSRNPFFNVSIGLLKGNEAVLGIVFAPVQNELFSAAKGEGAHLNGKPIRVSEKDDIKSSIITFCHSRKWKDTENISKVFHNFKHITEHFRQYGAAALELAYVASGRIESFMSFGLNVWDVTAGIVIVREAGGRVTDTKGRKVDVDSKEIVASNKNIHDKILKKIEDSI
ncbi:MAG: inositol monophosphatase [Candidatus Aenigmatarchaeota archaeon]|nr:MAG: inositol monophosphatase [Candidatus Aenigmarchaeota archaeon]